MQAPGARVLASERRTLERFRERLVVSAEAAREPSTFVGLLFEDAKSEGRARQEESFASDLNLDTIVASIVAGQEEPEFLGHLFYHQLHDEDAVHFRQEVFRDLEDPDLFRSLVSFTEKTRQVRTHLRELEKMRERRQREGWHLDAAAIYCEAVESLLEDLAPMRLSARALLGFRSHLRSYVASEAFCALASETTARKEELGSIRYCTRIRGARVEVTSYDGEADYSVEVLATFERFAQGAAKDYRQTYRTWPGINHVTGQILEMVARLFPREFAALSEYVRRHRKFFDGTLRQFEREIQFFLSYLTYIRPLRSAGLSFCYPDVKADSREIGAKDTFDLALAEKLVSRREPVVRNEWWLENGERIFVITGPNQGGKTTFARAFGQMHHLASLGCPVPGAAARVPLFDQLLTHFEREEDLARMTGKLEDDIVRVGNMLAAATGRSVIVLNEVFTSTTMQDARFLGTKLLAKVIDLDALCVYVTFVDELASLDPSIVSLMSTIVPDDPARRTYKIVRRRADGLAHALAIAENHNVSYEALRRRLVT